MGHSGGLPAVLWRLAKLANLCFSGGRYPGAERPRRPPINIGARPRLVKRSPGRPSACKHWLDGTPNLIAASRWPEASPVLADVLAKERRQVVRIPVKLAVQLVPGVRRFGGKLIEQGQSLLTVDRRMSTGKNGNCSPNEVGGRGGTERLEGGEGIRCCVAGGIRKELLKPAVVDFALKGVDALGNTLRRGKSLVPVPVPTREEEVAQGYGKRRRIVDGEYVLNGGHIPPMHGPGQPGDRANVSCAV